MLTLSNNQYLRVKKMINIQRAMRSNRIMKSLTGTSRSKFKSLLPYFEIIVREESAKVVKNSKNRQRAAGAGTKHTLDTVELQLFYVLFYMKVYPTFDVAGFIFGVDRSQTNRWTHKLLPILEKTLDRKMVLPKRKIDNVDEFIILFPDTKDIFIDGTERPVQRSIDYKKQKLNYSGKKKRHTVKNIVANDENRRILFVTPTVKGSMHDKKIYDKYTIGDFIPNTTTQWVDTGFIGIDKDYDIDIQMPKKKPKGKELTDEEKENNKIISSIRVINENAIGGIKRLRCVSDVYRNKKANIEDKFMIISAGIWNHEIEKTA